MALVLGAVGCTLMPAAPKIEGAPAALAVPGAFRMEGRIALRAEQQSFSGGIAWRRGPEGEDILLSSPLGQGVAEIRSGPGSVSLVDAEGRRYAAEDGEALLQRVLGWSLPLEGLGYWVTGRPDPGRPFVGAADEAGRWRNIEQDGWRIEFERYGVSDGAALPGKIVARRGEDLQIRLVVDSWRLE